jgi:hypothetical protein
MQQLLKQNEARKAACEVLNDWLGSLPTNKKPGNLFVDQ